MAETGDRVLVHRQDGYDFLIDTGWLFSVPRVVVKRGPEEGILWIADDDVSFCDDVTPFDEQESARVVQLVVENLDDLSSAFAEMRNDWKRDRLMERWGVDGQAVDDLLDRLTRDLIHPR